MQKGLTNTTGKLNRLPLSLLLGAVLLGGAASVKAFAPVGDDGELFVTTSASAAYNDNIFLSHSNDQSATVWDLAPGLSYEFGKGSALTKGELAFDEDFQEYSGVSHLTSKQLANAVFKLAYDDSKNKLNIDANFTQADQAQLGLQNLGYLVDRNVSHVDGLGEVALTEKVSVGAGVVYDDTDYTTTGFTNYQGVAVPVHVYYTIEPKVDVSAGFQYRDNTLGAGGIDSNDYYYNVGARGEFTPKLSGTIDVGYIEQVMKVGANQSGFGANSKFTYAYSPKTSLVFGVNDDFAYSPFGAPYRNLAVYGAVSTALNDQWKVGAQVGYNNNDYTTTSEQDNFYNAQASVSYVFNVNFTVTGAYNYSTDHSNLALAGFNDDTLTLSAVFHY